MPGSIASIPPVRRLLEAQLVGQVEGPGVVGLVTHPAQLVPREALEQLAVVPHESASAVHVARQEIAAAHTLWQFAERELELVEAELLPYAEENLELSREAFQAGEVTLLETLALQRALVEARTRHTEAHAERSKRAWEVLAASGWLLGGSPTDKNNEEE